MIVRVGDTLIEADDIIFVSRNWRTVQIKHKSSDVVLEAHFESADEASSLVGHLATTLMIRSNNESEKSESTS